MFQPPWLNAPDRPLVLAFGGNVLEPRGAPDGRAEERAEQLAAALLLLMPARSGLVLVHGNGPQVGRILLRVEATRDRMPPEPLDVLVAETQGSIGYLLSRALRNVTQRRQRNIEIATVATQIVVDADDPALHKPSKPIGPYYDAAEAEELHMTKGWEMVEEPGRGMRRVVPSPIPREIVELNTIAEAAGTSRVVIAGGGGGIPVTRTAWGELRGVEAVIDKDRTASLIARSIWAGGLVILTGVESVYLRYGRPDAEALRSLSVAEARDLLAAGEFPAGSMGPKIDAVTKYAAAMRNPGLITSIDALPAALEGQAGTWVTA